MTNSLGLWPMVVYFSKIVVSSVYDLDFFLPGLGEAFELNDVKCQFCSDFRESLQPGVA